MEITKEVTELIIDEFYKVFDVKCRKIVFG